MKLEIKKRDIIILIYVAGILILFLVYFLFFRNISDRTDRLDDQIKVLTQQKTDLELLDAKKADYQEKTEEMQKEIDKIVAEFPAEVKEEDSVAYANSLEKIKSMSVNNITIGEKQLLYSTTSQGNDSQTTDATTNNTSNNAADNNTTDSTTDNTVEASAADDSSTARFLFKLPITYEYTVSYGSFKKALSTIAECKDKKNVESVTLSYDDKSGKLIGSAVVNMYYMLGTDTSYREPNTGEVAQGVDNIFGTVGN